MVIENDPDAIEGICDEKAQKREEYPRNEDVDLFLRDDVRDYVLSH